MTGIHFQKNMYFSGKSWDRFREFAGFKKETPDKQESTLSQQQQVIDAEKIAKAELRERADLMRALENKADKIVQDLLIRHPEFIKNPWGSRGDSVLQMAITRENRPMVQWLLQNGADPNQINFKGDTALITALSASVHGDTPDRAIVTMLLGANTQPHLRNIHDENALHLAARVKNSDWFLQTLLTHYPALVRTISLSDTHGYMPLHYAVKSGHPQNVALLLKHGADVNALIPATHQTPLHLAVFFRRPDVVRLLLDHKANVHIEDKKYNTPMLLHLASLHPNRDIFDMLLAAGAKVDASLKSAGLHSGKNTLHLAAMVKETPYFTEKLLPFYKDTVNIKDNRKLTPLHLAAYQGHPENISLLLKAGAAVDARSVSDSTPLHIACSPGSASDETELIPKVQKLLAAGALVNVVDDQQESPLTLAVGANFPQITRMLLDHKADPNHRSYRNLTAVMYAAARGNLDLAQMLVETGADVNAVDDDGLTALLWALRQKQTQMAQYLREKGAR